MTRITLDHMTSSCRIESTKPERLASMRNGLVATTLIALLLSAGCGGSTAEANGNGAASEQTDAEDEGKTFVGVDLGAFHLKEPRPIENQKIEVHFVVHAIVQSENKERFEQFAESHLHAMRDQIVTAVRTTDSPEFDEPELKRLRRRMLLRIARLLGEPIVEDLFLTEFRCQTD